MLTKRKIAIFMFSIAVIMVAVFIGVRANHNDESQEVLFGGTFVMNEEDENETMPAFNSEAISNFCKNSDTTDCFKRLEKVTAFL